MADASTTQMFQEGMDSYVGGALVNLDVPETDVMLQAYDDNQWYDPLLDDEKEDEWEDDLDREDVED